MSNMQRSHIMAFSYSKIGHYHVALTNEAFDDFVHQGIGMVYD